MITIRVKSRPTRAASHLPENADLLNSNWRFVFHQKTWRPPTDFYETDDAFVVRVEIAGVMENDIEIGINQNQISISGVRSDATEKRAYHLMEINQGEFYTAVDLPTPVDFEQAQAVYHDGMLKITLPKAQPKEIKVNTAPSTDDE